MAKIRIGFSTHFEVENELVGIGTDNPTNTKQVLGNIKSSDVKVIGVSTFTSFDGFTDTKLNLHGSVGSKQHTTSSEIIIDGEVTVSSGTTYTSGPENLTVTDNFTLPGISDDKPSVGTMRFNENLAALEFYTGVEWKAVNSYIDMGNRSRGFSTNGDRTTPSIDQINISTKGNAISKHQSTLARNGTAGCSNSTRGLLVGGSTPTKLNNIEYITMASSGDAIDFGDLPANYGVEMSACASSTRGLFGGGYFPGRSNAIHYVQINTTGASQDFGDLTSIMVSVAALASPTRAIFWGGYRTSPGNMRDIDMVTIASKGNSVDFGSGDSVARTSGCSNTTRGMVGGGRRAPGNPAGVGDEIDYITIASTGNATYFGDLTKHRVMPGGCSSHTRAVWMGGYNNPVYPRTIDYVEFATQGNATDFGEATQEDRHSGGFSDCHGGLGGF
jgi:hypothetical protein